jgi:hypothetical protein
MNMTQFNSQSDFARLPDAIKTAPLPEGCTESSAFCDRRVFFVRPDDYNAPSFHADDSFGFCRACDGPTYLVIGKRVSDECIDRNLDILARYNVTANRLSPIEIRLGCNQFRRT